MGKRVKEFWRKRKQNWIKATNSRIAYYMICIYFRICNAFNASFTLFVRKDLGTVMSTTLDKCVKKGISNRLGKYIKKITFKPTTWR